MLFMTIAAYEPEKRNEIIKRRAEKGTLVPKGVKIINEWAAVGGGRVFRLIDVEDPKAGYEGALAWSDLCKIEIIPVLEVEEAMKLVPKKL